MSKYPFITSLACLFFFASAMPTLTADEGATEEENGSLEFTPTSLQEIKNALFESGQTVQAKEISTSSISPFTGKVKASKLRVRVAADPDSQVAVELPKNSLVIVNGEKGDYYSIQAPDAIKGYVFRSLVLDGVVEAAKANVRLAPSLEAPVIAHLNAGDKVGDHISEGNKKWYEVSLPETTRFYVAKQFVEKIGDVSFKEKMDRKKAQATQLLTSAEILTKNDLKKSFDQIDLQEIKNRYETLISDFPDFPEITEQAQKALHQAQEDYMSQRIHFLESQVEAKEQEKAPTFLSAEKVKAWAKIEDQVYLSWAKQHEDRSIEDFYAAQKQEALTLTGVLEPYTTPVKNRPGNYLIKQQDLPVAYVYSTVVDLDAYVGKQISLVAAPRDNNNFAFPAYFVLDIE